MGYYTRYSLTFELPTDVAPSLVACCADQVAAWIRGNEEASTALQEDGSPADRSTWYGHETDLRLLSANVRGVLFILDCMGEDGAHWRVYAKNGKAVHVKPVLVWKVPKL